eukprot:Sspe_Gene.31764::Locus_15633_Transcript_7_8_Confidence_0.385_Length_2101::g.31764::m.31764
MTPILASSGGRSQPPSPSSCSSGGSAVSSRCSSHEAFSDSKRLHQHGLDSCGGAGARGRSQSVVSFASCQSHCSSGRQYNEKKRLHLHEVDSCREGAAGAEKPGVRRRNSCLAIREGKPHHSVEIAKPGWAEEEAVERSVVDETSHTASNRAMAKSKRRHSYHVAKPVDEEGVVVRRSPHESHREFEIAKKYHEMDVNYGTSAKGAGEAGGVAAVVAEPAGVAEADGAQGDDREPGGPAGEARALRLERGVRVREGAALAREGQLPVVAAVVDGVGGVDDGELAVPVEQAAGGGQARVPARVGRAAVPAPPVDRHRHRHRVVGVVVVGGGELAAVLVAHRVRAEEARAPPRDRRVHPAPERPGPRARDPEVGAVQLAPRVHLPQVGVPPARRPAGLTRPFPVPLPSPPSTPSPPLPPPSSAPPLPDVVRTKRTPHTRRHPPSPF